MLLLSIPGATPNAFDLGNAFDLATEMPLIWADRGEHLAASGSYKEEARAVTPPKNKCRINSNQIKSETR
eukprot:2705423-Rhodomonas_salina.1